MIIICCVFDVLPVFGCRVKRLVCCLFCPLLSTVREMYLWTCTGTMHVVILINYSCAAFKTGLTTKISTFCFVSFSAKIVWNTLCFYLQLLRNTTFQPYFPLAPCCRCCYRLKVLGRWNLRVLTNHHHFPFHNALSRKSLACVSVL